MFPSMIKCAKIWKVNFIASPMSSLPITPSYSLFQQKVIRESTPALLSTVAKKSEKEIKDQKEKARQLKKEKLAEKQAQKKIKLKLVEREKKRKRKGARIEKETKSQR